MMWRTVRFLELVVWAQRTFPSHIRSPGRLLVIYRTAQELW